jgi:hypothetical protein
VEKVTEAIAPDRLSEPLTRKLQIEKAKLLDLRQPLAKAVTPARASRARGSPPGARGPGQGDRRLRGDGHQGDSAPQKRNGLLAGARSVDWGSCGGLQLLSESSAPGPISFFIAEAAGRAVLTGEPASTLRRLWAEVRARGETPRSGPRARQQAFVAFFVHVQYARVGIREGPMIFLRKLFSHLMDNPLLGLIAVVPMIAGFIVLGPILACVSFLFGKATTGKHRVIALVCLPFAFLPLLAVGEATGMWKTGSPKPRSPVRLFRSVGKSVPKYTDAQLRATLGPPAQTSRTERGDGGRTEVLTWEHVNARGRVLASFEVTLEPCPAGWCAQRARLTKGEDTTTYSAAANARRAWRNRWTGYLSFAVVGVVGAVLVFASIWQVGTAFKKAREEAAAERAKRRAAAE